MPGARCTRDLTPPSQSFACWIKSLWGIGGEVAHRMTYRLRKPIAQAAKSLRCLLRNA